MKEKKIQGPAVSNKRDFFILLGVGVVLGLVVLWSYFIKPTFFADTDMKYAYIYHEDQLLEKVALDGSIHEWIVDFPEENGAHIHEHADGEEESHNHGHEHDHDHDHDHEDAYLIISTNADRSIQVDEANCPDEICVNTGKVSMEGQSIACLPYRIFIKVLNADGVVDNGVDG